MSCTPGISSPRTDDPHVLGGPEAGLGIPRLPLRLQAEDRRRGGVGDLGAGHRRHQQQRERGGALHRAFPHGEGTRAAASRSDATDPLSVLGHLTLLSAGIPAIDRRLLLLARVRRDVRRRDVVHLGDGFDPARSRGRSSKSRWWFRSDQGVRAGVLVGRATCRGRRRQIRVLGVSQAVLMHLPAAAGLPEAAGSAGARGAGVGMAGGAVADVLREEDVREVVGHVVEADDLQPRASRGCSARRSRRAAGRSGTVNHRPEVDGLVRGGVLGDGAAPGSAGLPGQRRIRIVARAVGGNAAGACPWPPPSRSIPPVLWQPKQPWGSARPPPWACVLTWQASHAAWVMTSRAMASKPEAPPAVGTNFTVVTAPDASRAPLGCSVSAT